MNFQSFYFALTINDLRKKKNKKKIRVSGNKAKKKQNEKKK